MSENFEQGGLAVSKEPMIVLTTPEERNQLQGLPVIAAHMAYSVGAGTVLLRAQSARSLGGGYLVLNSSRYDGTGRIEPFCQQVVQECQYRRFQGIVCDFEGGRLPPLEKIIHILGEQCANRGWKLLVSEQYGHSSPHAAVMIPTAISGGTLETRLQEAQQEFGQHRIALALQRTAEDFYLPAPNGRGISLSQKELRQQLETRNPSVFFSREFCARYFTYMSQETGAHFVLFDDPATMQKKVELAANLGITTVLAAWQDIADATRELGLSNTRKTQVLR